MYRLSQIPAGVRRGVGMLLRPCADTKRSLIAGQGMGRSGLFPGHRLLEASRALLLCYTTMVRLGSFPESLISPQRSRRPPDTGGEQGTAKSLQSCPTLCDPIDGSPPGSPVPGILQARTLEWVAISFSNA